MSISRPIQCYLSHANPIWPVGTFKEAREIEPQVKYICKKG